MNVLSKEYAVTRIKELEYICAFRPTLLALADLGACYFTMDRPHEALPLLQRAWDKGRHLTVGVNLTMVLKELGRHEEAATVIEQSYWNNDDDFYYKLAYAESLLRAGFWKQAWPIYDNCRPTQQAAAIDLRIPYSVKEWDGGSLPEGHVLLVINEGGTGDRLSYARWLPELNKRGINWMFYPYDELYSLFTRVFPPERLVKNGEDIPDPTHWTTTFSLPAKLNAGMTEIPEPLHFVATEKKAREYTFTQRDDLPIIGICYEAAERFQGGKKVRSLSEGQAMRLVTMLGARVHFVNLQHETRMPFPVSNIPLKTWEDTVALVQNLDAVITVDTAVFWLASSMKKPTALLLSGNSDWKFGPSKLQKCYWSDSVRYFRNATYGFENAIDELILAVRNGEWPPKPSNSSQNS